ncbi:MAG: hypothetical protein VKJ64_01635, partial [Leptolyngbyaceae bacterium]|nr:hypothetical protein [Leptolyngbyaceae bacterium]
LYLEIESFAWSTDFLVFHEEGNKIGFSTDFEIPEWNTKAVNTYIESNQEIRDRTTFSEFSMEIEVARRSGYYIFKIIIPLILIVGCSWSVFWMIGDGLADRMSVSLTGVLTVVAYQFLISEDLPRASIVTLMDGILLVSFTFMVLTIFENVVVNVLYLREQETLATKIDRTCAYGFPTAYGLSLVTLTLVYLWIL